MTLRGMTLRSILFGCIATFSVATAAATPERSLFDEASIKRGSEAFAQNCAACHGTDANGAAPFFPSLIETARQGDPASVVRSAMHGKYGETVDHNSRPLSLMPPWDHLANEQIADIVNFLFARAGVSSKTLQAEQVARYRAQSATPHDIVPLDDTQFARASTIYFARCAACHGIDRLGAAGSPLQSWAMRNSGSEAIRTIMHFGSPWGMPAWGMSERLAAEDMAMMARFLQMEAPPAPRFDEPQVQGSWQLITPIQQRPAERHFAASARNLFVSLLHDVGRVALINASTYEIMGTIDTGLAPHDIDVSADGRYLYVLSRGGIVALVDLFMEKPSVVARLRVGYEARSLAVGQQGQHLVVGAYWPPQFVVADAQTLEPRWTHVLDNGAWEQGNTRHRISQVSALPKQRFLLAAKEAGELIELGSGPAPDKRLTRHSTEAFLRAGSFDLTGRFFLIPTDKHQVVVADTEDGLSMKTVSAPHLLGGGRGSAYHDSKFGPVWAASGMASDLISVIGTDSGNYPEAAWRVVRELELPGGGSLHTATHSASSNLWADMSLHASSKLAHSVAVFDTDHLDAPARTLPIASWAGLSEPSVRAIQPQFNASGSEVWFTLYNRQDQTAAVVVVDDEKLELRKVIRDARLVTPTRTFSLGSILAR